MRHVGALPRRGIAAQRDDVAHARLPVAARDVEDLAARRADAGQVRRRGQRGLAQDARHDVVRALAGRPVRAVGDRHEAWRERREALDRLPERLLHRRVVGREELEGHRYRLHVSHSGKGFWSDLQAATASGSAAATASSRCAPTTSTRTQTIASEACVAEPGAQQFERVAVGRAQVQRVEVLDDEQPPVTVAARAPPHAALLPVDPPPRARGPRPRRRSCCDGCGSAASSPRCSTQ